MCKRIISMMFIEFSENFCPILNDPLHVVYMSGKDESVMRNLTSTITVYFE